MLGGVWRRPACRVHCAAAPPAGLSGGARWSVVPSQTARFTNPYCLTMARHHSLVRVTGVLGEGCWKAFAQRQPRAVMAHRLQWSRWHCSQWRSCATAASPPTSTPTGDESRLKEAGVRCRPRQLLLALWTSLACRALTPLVRVVQAYEKRKNVYVSCAPESRGSAKDWPILA